jgi:hypothetical protein
MRVHFHRFFTWALDGGEWSASRSCSFIREWKAPVAHWIGGWVGLRAALDVVESRRILPYFNSFSRNISLEADYEVYTKIQ